MNDIILISGELGSFDSIFAILSSKAMQFLNEKFAEIFDNKQWREVIFDKALYPHKNGRHWGRGDPYKQVGLEIPWVRNTFGFTDWEIDYDSEPVLNWMKNNNYMLPILSCVAYVLFVFVIGPKIVEIRGKPFGLNGPLALWNLLLSVFSFWGASRTVPHLFWRLANETFEDTVCRSPHVAFGGGATGVAVQFFCLSKIPELIDTVFLVLKKKPVIFLHWYHHITVLLYCWNSYVTESAAGLYFCAMNYCVHALMYFYFFLMAIQMVPKWFNPFILTAFQISQMVVGTSVVGACIYYHYYGTKTYQFQPNIVGTRKCNNLESNLIAGGIMYASYLYLFCEFAVKRFFFGINEYEKKPKVKDQ